MGGADEFDEHERHLVAWAASGRDLDALSIATGLSKGTLGDHIEELGHKLYARWGLGGARFWPSHVLLPGGVAAAQIGVPDLFASLREYPPPPPLHAREGDVVLIQAINAGNKGVDIAEGRGGVPGAARDALDHLKRRFGAKTDAHLSALAIRYGVTSELELTSGLLKWLDARHPNLLNEDQRRSLQNSAHSPSASRASWDGDRVVDDTFSGDDVELLTLWAKGSRFDEAREYFKTTDEDVSTWSERLTWSKLNARSRAQAVFTAHALGLLPVRRHTFSTDARENALYVYRELLTTRERRLLPHLLSGRTVSSLAAESRERYINVLEDVRAIEFKFGARDRRELQRILLGTELFSGEDASRYYLGSGNVGARPRSELRRLALLAAAEPERNSGRLGEYQRQLIQGTAAGFTTEERAVLTSRQVTTIRTEIRRIKAWAAAEFGFDRGRFNSNLVLIPAGMAAGLLSGEGIEKTLHLELLAHSRAPGAGKSERVDVYSLTDEDVLSNRLRQFLSAYRIELTPYERARLPDLVFGRYSRSIGWEARFPPSRAQAEAETIYAKLGVEDGITLQRFAFATGLYSGEDVRRYYRTRPFGLGR